MKKIKEAAKSNMARNLVAILVIVIWVAALVLRWQKSIELPMSLEIGITIVFAYIFGTTAIQIIVDYFKGKK